MTDIPKQHAKQSLSLSLCLLPPPHLEYAVRRLAFLIKISVFPMNNGRVHGCAIHYHIGLRCWDTRVDDLQQYTIHYLINFTGV